MVHRTSPAGNLSCAAHPIGWRLPRDWQAGALWLLALECTHRSGAGLYVLHALTNDRAEVPDPREVVRRAARRSGRQIEALFDVVLIERVQVPGTYPHATNVCPVIDLRRAARPRKSR